MYSKSAPKRAFEVTETKTEIAIAFDSYLLLPFIIARMLLFLPFLIECLCLLIQRLKLRILCLCLSTYSCASLKNFCTVALVLTEEVIAGDY